MESSISYDSDPTSTNTSTSTCKEYCEKNKISSPYHSSLIINTLEYNCVIDKLRSFFVLLTTYCITFRVGCFG